MSDRIKSVQDHIEDALEAAEMAWWELEFPSGALSFSKQKTDMLGYEKKDFIHFRHFTKLIHPDDYKATMKAMKDHYEDKVPVYETTYRIMHKNGSYLTFHDKGRIVERSKNSFIVAGIIRKISEK